MNNKLKILITMGIAIGGIRAVRANPLQINEARQELARLSSARSEAKLNLDRAKVAFNDIDRATDKQTKALKLLIDTDRLCQKAQGTSQSSVQIGRSLNGYMADQGHSTGTALLIEKPRYLEEELEGYQKGS